MDANPEALQTMARFYARHGVTAFLATTMSAPAHEIAAALGAVGELMRAGTGGAALLGAHVEGPYLDTARRGAQEARWVRPAAADEYPALFDSGVVRLITLAPELPESPALIRFARQRDAVVSIGHTRASHADMCAAVSLGASQVTHLFNGMDPLHHREPGAVGAALTLEALTCELIADLVHVHPAVLALAYRCKGPDRIALVTDAMSGTGMPDGDYTLGGAPVSVRDGIARTAEGALAGSTLTLERAVAHMAHATGEPLARVLPMATRTPARCLGLPGKGDISVGQDADLVVLAGEMQVRMTMVQGEVVWARKVTDDER
jgi:N-acetylglucosamine-6-phosphate deacetylase